MTNPEINHLSTLILHGAKIGFEYADVASKMDLSFEFYKQHLDFIRTQPFINALTFELYLPGIDETMVLTIWKDGHIDSGSKENMRRVLDR